MEISLSTLANVATVLGTGLVVWAYVSKLLARVRRRWVGEWLTISECLILSLMTSLVFAAVAEVLFLTIQNGSLLAQHTKLLKEFNYAVKQVLTYGQNISRLLHQLLGSSKKR